MQTPSRPSASAIPPLPSKPTPPSPYDLLPAADWSGWDKIDAEEFWYRVYDVEDGVLQGDAELAAKLSRWSLKDKAHFDRIKEAYVARSVDDDAFTQAMMNGRMRQVKEKMAAANDDADLTTPVRGVDLKTYATIVTRKARLPAGDAAAAKKLYAEFGLDEATFHAAHKGWQARMQDSSADPFALAALMTEYGRHVTAAGGTHPAASAADQAAVAPAPQTGPTGPEPCSLERWVEIRVAERCWIEQSLDVAENLMSHFNLTPAEWADVNDYWTRKYQAHPAMKKDFDRFERKYEIMYGAAA